MGSSLANLKLNMYEYSAFKLFCIWNLKFHKTSTALKIVAQEHYEGVCSALRNYYETQTKMDDFEIAIRIGDITLQIVTVSVILSWNFVDKDNFCFRISITTSSSYCSILEYLFDVVTFVLY